MSLFKTNLILVSLILLSTGCNKYPKRGKSLNHGEIIADFKTYDCYGSIKTYTAGKCIVRNMSDFDTSSNLSCTPALKDFDFNTHSILGLDVLGKCDLKIIRELKIDHEAKTYFYTIAFKDAGLCCKLSTSQNLVIVPKIPDDYKVIFESREE